MNKHFLLLVYQMQNKFKQRLNDYRDRSSFHCGSGMVVANKIICMRCKPESRRVRIVWFFRMAIVAAILLCQPSTFAQTPGISAANGTASLSWPLTAYYYLLQSSTNLSGSNAWLNVATASLVSTLVTAAPFKTNMVGNNFVITQSVANTPQFFRLKSPVFIPVFSFAIFYDGLLEFTLTPDMVPNGSVHANGPINIGTSASLVFNFPVTTASTITGPTRDGFTPSPWNQNTTFNGKPPYVTNTPAFLSPLGTNNPHVLIEMPPTSENPTSLLGQCRLYNQAQVLIIVTNLPAIGANYPIAQVTMTFQISVNGMIPGADPNTNIYPYIYTNAVFTNYSPGIYANEPHGLETFLSLTNTFTDKREYKTNMFVTQIDVAHYGNWLATNPIAVAKFGGPPVFILYVADWRNVGTNKLSVVRLVNGAQLPSNGGLGFTVATPNPLYVRGNYNVTADGIHFALTPGSTINAGTTVPASLLCDAITILSSVFNDSTSSNTIGTASASTTVNAAVVAGNVPSTGTTAATFSGGVHNFVRLQEDWTGDYLILNTSLVCLFGSQMATNQFRNPVGWIPSPKNPYYKPPTRQWGFDLNFFDPNKQPPGTPVYTLP